MILQKKTDVMEDITRLFRKYIEVYTP